ncbi:MAG: SemiSWEET transporter [Ignavibacteriales bacterium]|nr:MAG: SemiSWEET transporter [Ignavibacteriales bacterium]
MSSDFIFGYLAAFCTTASFVPQAFKVFKTRKTSDISIGMFLLMTLGVLSWLIYGLILLSPPIIAANSITLLLSLYILLMKFRLDYLKK